MLSLYLYTALFFSQGDQYGLKMAKTSGPLKKRRGWGPYGLWSVLVPIVFVLIMSWNFIILKLDLNLFKDNFLILYFVFFFLIMHFFVHFIIACVYSYFWKWKFLDIVTGISSADQSNLQMYMSSLHILPLTIKTYIFNKLSLYIFLWEKNNLLLRVTIYPVTWFDVNFFFQKIT